MYSQHVLKILVFLLPTQLGLHFWPSFSRVVGIRIDYLSPTLYLTDILLSLYLVLNISKISIFLKNHLKLIFLILCFIILNSYFGVSPLNSLYWWSRNILYLLFVLTLKLNRIKVKDIIKPFTYSLILILVIQILQSLKQGSLGGLFYYLGERHFTFSTPNLARLTFFNQEFIRVPSIFPHANSLAGYLLLSLFMIPASRFMILPTLGILLTASKSAIFALVFGLFFFRNTKPVVFFSIIFSLVLLVSSTIYHPQPTIKMPETVSSRLDLVTSASTIITEYPITGVGLGNFIPALANNLPSSHLTYQYLQPVHNIFILLLSELGFPVFIIILYYLRSTTYDFRSNKIAKLLMLICITGFFDHYWLTITQNRLLLSLLLGIFL